MSSVLRKKTVGEIVMAAQLEQGHGGLLPLASEAGHGHAYIVVYHFVEYGAGVGEKGRLGFQNGQGVLPVEHQGEAIVAMGTGEHGQVIAAGCPADLQLDLPQSNSHTDPGPYS